MKEVVYRIYLNSADILTGNTQNGVYSIKMPQTVNKGYVFVESLAITSGGTLFNNKRCFRVVVDEFSNRFVYCSDDLSPHIIAEIPLEDDYHLANDHLAYQRPINRSDVGYPIKNFKFYNSNITVRFLDAANAALDSAQLTSWNMCLCIVDLEPNMDAI